MSKLRSILCSIAVLACVLGAVEARADQVMLTNGDILTGEVRDSGDFLVLDHPVLGTLTIPRSDVASWDNAVKARTATGAERGSAPGATTAANAPSRIAPLTPICPVPPVRLAPDPCARPWDFAVGLGLADDAGNTDKTRLNGDIEAAYRWRRNEVDWRASAFYEESRGVQTEGKYSSLLGYRRRLTKRGSFRALALLQRDDFADILLRSGVFGAYEHAFVQTSSVRLSTSVGLGAVRENRDGFPSLRTMTAFAGASYEQDFKAGDSFELRAYMVPYFDSFERSPYHLSARYIHPLRYGLSLTAGFILDYVQDPPGDVRDYDTKFTVGLRWSP